MNRLCFFTLLTIFLSCDQADTSGIENITEINLRFSDFNPGIHKGFIDLTIENAINPIQEQLKITDSGTVSFSFINPKKTEILFGYESSDFSQIVSPGEKFSADLKLSELLDQSRFSDFTITGKNEATNRLIAAHTFYLDSLLENSSRFFYRDSSITDIEFKARRISEMNDQLQELDAYILAKDIQDETFINWSKAQIRCGAGEDLSIYPFFGRINRTLTHESPYFEFVREVKPETDNEITYLSYLRYLESLSTAYVIMGNVSKKYENARARAREDSLTNFPISYGIIKGLPASDEKRLLMAYAFRKYKKVPANYQDSAKYIAGEKLFAQLSLEGKHDRSSIIALIKDYEISKKEKDELLEMYRDTEGKVIFHDFWFTNCGPCMKELPNYNDLIASVGQDVVFIFYGAYMQERIWKEARETLDLKGRHYLLTKNQLAFFEKYFKLHGFPHHQLINTNGQIVTERIPAVYPRNFDHIVRLIEAQQ